MGKVICKLALYKKCFDTNCSCFSLSERNETDPDGQFVCYRETKSRDTILLEVPDKSESAPEDLTAKIATLEAENAELKKRVVWVENRITKYLEETFSALKQLGNIKLGN